MIRCTEVHYKWKYPNKLLWILPQFLSFDCFSRKVTETFLQCSTNSCVFVQWLYSVVEDGPPPFFHIKQMTLKTSTTPPCEIYYLVDLTHPVLTLNYVTQSLVTCHWLISLRKICWREYNCAYIALYRLSDVLT